VGLIRRDGLFCLVGMVVIAAWSLGLIVFADVVVGFVARLFGGG